MLHLLKYRFRLMIRNRVLLFQTLIFLMLLTIFFRIVLEDAYTVNTFQTIPITAVEQEDLSQLKAVLKDVRQGDIALFKVSYVGEERAKQLLKEDKVSAVVKLQDPITITMSQNGLDQAVTKTFFDEYSQKIYLVEETIQQYPDGSAVSTLFTQTVSHVKETNTNHIDLSSVFFYTILTTNAIFDGYQAINSIYELQTNQSECTAYLTVSPLHKGGALLADFIIDIAIQIVFLFIQFAYMYFTLDVSFESQLGYVFLVMVLGAFTGNAFDILTGSITGKIPPDDKTGIMTSITLICSALAGMVAVQLKYYVQEYAPFLTCINPVNMITDGLHSLCYYGVSERYFLNLALLAGFTMVCYLVSFRIFSRKNYHSLGVRQVSVLKVYYKVMKSHWLTLVIYISIFFTVFFVFDMSASKHSNIKMYEGSKPSIAVLDRDDSSLSEGLLTYPDTQVNIKHRNVSNSDAQNALFHADISVIITIPEGFEEEFVSGKEAVSMNQRPDDMDGVLLQRTVSKYLDTIHAYKKLYLKQGISELYTRVQKNLNITAEVKMSDSKEVITFSMLRGAYFNYASYIMLVVTILLIGLMMHPFFDAEITKRNLIAPVSQNRMNLQLVFCNLSVGTALWGLMMLMIPGMVWDSMMTLGGLLEIVNASVFMLVCVSMSFMFCVTSVKSKHPDDMLSGINSIVGLGSSFLCDAFVPLSMIEENILMISRFLPSYWYVKLNNLLTSAVHVGDMLLQETFMTYGALLLFAVVFLYIALVIMKSRRTQGALEDTSMQP